MMDQLQKPKVGLNIRSLTFQCISAHPSMIYRSRVRKGDIQKHSCCQQMAIDLI